MSSSSNPSAAAPAEFPEAMLNRLLRRVDWRFLLPSPRVRRAVCFADDELRDAVALIAERLEPVGAGAAGCDLAVVVDPDGPTLHAAWVALRPGGLCYVEWTRRAEGGRRRLRRQLHQTGFERVRFYLPWRSLGRAAAWIPLESPTARRYFHRHLHARTPHRRLPARVIRTLFTLGARAGLVRPLCTLARKPSGVEQGDGSPLFVETIRREWRNWELPGEPGELSLMLLTGGPRTGSKVAGLVFNQASAHPALIVKLARSGQADAGLLREARMLSALDPRCRNGPVQVPRVLFSVESDAVAVGETALQGAPLLTLLNQRNYRGFALQATDWLITLANSSRRDDPGAARRLVGDVTAEFEQTFGRAVEPGLLEHNRRVLARIDQLPLVWEHRDFSPWNLFVTPGARLAVFDWESSEADGLPLLDLIYFVTYLGSALRRENTPEGVLRAWRATGDPRRLVGSVRAECVGRYLAGVGLDPQAIPALAVLVWMIHSRAEHRRLAADAAGQPTAEVLRRSLFLRLWEAELDRQSSS